VLEGPIAPTECVDNPGVCERSGSCVTRDVWDELKKAMESVLEATTLQDLVDRHRKKSSAEKLTYYV
jgi:Rrf2 family transcriptional regulator, cysteine metabolism repressor